MPRTSSQPSMLEMLEGISHSLAALGLITFVLFPFALPMIVLTVFVLVLAAIPVAVGGLLFAALVGPALLVKRRRAARRARRLPTEPVLSRSGPNGNSQRNHQPIRTAGLGAELR